MKTSDIKPNTLIAFNYKKTHPKEDRLFYVTKVEANCIVGNEFSDIGAPIKKFLTSYIVNLSQVPSAKLPLEAKPYCYEIFSDMLGEDENDIKTQEVHGELIGYSKLNKEITASFWRYNDAVTIEYGGKEIKLIVNGGVLSPAGGQHFKTPQELAQYILTKLS